MGAAYHTAEQCQRARRAKAWLFCCTDEGVVLGKRRRGVPRIPGCKGQGGRCWKTGRQRSGAAWRRWGPRLVAKGGSRGRGSWDTGKEVRHGDGQRFSKGWVEATGQRHGRYSDSVPHWQCVAKQSTSGAGFGGRVRIKGGRLPNERRAEQEGPQRRGGVHMGGCRPADMGWYAFFMAAAGPGRQPRATSLGEQRDGRVLGWWGEGTVRDNDTVHSRQVGRGVGW